MLPSDHPHCRSRAVPREDGASSSLQNRAGIKVDWLRGHMRNELDVEWSRCCRIVGPFQLPMSLTNGAGATPEIGCQSADPHVRVGLRIARTGNRLGPRFLDEGDVAHQQAGEEIDRQKESRHARDNEERILSRIPQKVEGCHSQDGYRAERPDLPGLSDIVAIAAVGSSPRVLSEKMVC